MKSDELREWCEQKLGAGVDKFALFSVAIDRNKLLDQVELLDPKTVNPIDVLENLEERAAKHANDHGGRHTFEVHATCAGEDKGLTTFQVHAELDGFTEPQNAGGILAQAMRHTEAFARIATSTALTMQERSNKFIDRQADRIEHLEGQRLEVLETLESVMLNKAERDRETLKVIASEERKNLGARKLLEFAPALAATVMPKMLPADQLDAVTAHAMRDLLENLDEKQLQAVIAVLPPEKQVAMFNLMKRLAKVTETNTEVEEKEKAGLAKVTETNTEVEEKAKAAAEEKH